MNRRLKIKDGKVLRHSVSNRFVHWTVAVSVIVLIVTGLGQLPLYSRYIVLDLPGTAWLKSYEATLWIHYLFAVVLLFILAYHLVYHWIRREFDIWPKKGDVKKSWQLIKAMILKREEPPCDKYLPEQRLTYLYFAVSLFLIVVTGVLKMVKNIAGLNPENAFFFWTAQLHNLGTVMIVFGLIAHLGAFAFKINRKLLPGMFTGYVDLEYARQRHPYWCRLTDSAAGGELPKSTNKGRIRVKANVGTVDRIVRIVLGIGLLSLLFILEGGSKYVGLLGLIPLATGIFRFCPLYPIFKINTCSVKKKRGAGISR